MSAMDSSWQQKVSESQAALKQMDEELKSFKDRVAGDVALSIRTGKLESTKYPVSKTRLKEMYNNLRRQWPTIKKQLKAQKETSEQVKALIKKTFDNAFENMEQKKNHIDEVFGLNEFGYGPAPWEVHQFIRSTFQHLQLAVYQKRLDEKPGPKTQDVMEHLTAHCLWLGELMALNDPPLQPDWENHDPGMDAWNILPQTIAAYHSVGQDLSTPGQV